MILLKRASCTVLLVFLSLNLWGQTPQITPHELRHDFGRIEEIAGSVSHTFTFENTGNAPLVIKYILVSCGCSKPEWTQTPVAPGEKGQILLTFDPENLIGPFVKTLNVYSNATEKPLTLYVEGDVIPRPDIAAASFLYSIGGLQLTKQLVDFDALSLNKKAEQRIYLKNTSEHPLVVKPQEVPAYLRVEAFPDTIYPNELGDARFYIHVSEEQLKGHLSGAIQLVVQHEAGEDKGVIGYSANVIDDFTQMTADEMTNAPAVSINPTLVDLSTLKASKGFLGIGKKKYLSVDITNIGRSLLKIYSITANTDCLILSNDKAEIQPDEMLELKISPAKKHTADVPETYITLVTNDPAAPIRIIEVKH